MTRFNRHSPLLAPAIFAVLTVAMFFDVLASGSRVLSWPSTDLALQFIPWREFGFSQLRAGNLALWNPHIYGGTPYFAGFQSALLYPPNWLHLILPIGVAINGIIALHVFCAGYFTSLWCQRRQISTGGSIVAGAMFMFSGPYFLHIYAGHLPHLCVMVWAPLILLAIDGLSRDGRIGWALVGAIAVAMQVFAGHPQYVYYTAIAFGLYTVLLLVKSPHRLRLVACFVVIYLGGAMLAAVQLLQGIETTGESVRGPGTAFEFASTFSLPPGNLLTLITPHFFGRLPDGYWGPGYLWEMCIWVSLTGLVLAIVAAVSDRRWLNLVTLVMAGLMLLLALGRHTPVYRLMYDYVPYYDGFRGTVKFAYLAMLFVAALAASGFDALLRRDKPTWILIGSVTVGCGVMLFAAWWIATSSASNDGAWARWLQRMASKYTDAGELFTRRAEDYTRRDFIAASSTSAARALWWSALTGAALVVVLIVARFRRVATYGLILLAIVELFVFARDARVTMPLSRTFPPDSRPEAAAVYQAWEAALQQLPRDQRVLTVLAQISNYGMSMGFDNLWGYDPLVLRRYAELMAASQGENPDNASQYLAFRQVIAGVFRMLRCGLILLPDARQPVAHVTDPLPVATLVGYWVVLPSRDAALSYLLKDDFDPRYALVLESDPGISSAQASAAGGGVQTVASTTDSLELRVQLTRPAILLITNNFAKGWRARSLSRDAPQRYKLMPANYALQAIPLEPGTHHLLVEYAPASFRVGVWMTAMSVVATVICASLLLRRRSGKPAGNPCAAA